MQFWTNFWEMYQDQIIALGKALIISLVIILLASIISRIVKKCIINGVKKVDRLDESTGKVFASVSKVFIWIFALLIILDQFGVNTASILTVLGAAGLAVGLAMKDSLSNVAAGLMLLILRPYKAGDYVDCGTVSGTIKMMGLFSTEVETIDGMFIMIPNSVIIAAPVKNYSRNPRRRADIPVGIAYGDSLPDALTALKKLMNENEQILQDPAPEVLVSELADHSVNLTLRFWTENGNYWNVYWQIKSQLKGAIEDSGLHIPFPQRVITLASPLPEELKK